MSVELNAATRFQYQEKYSRAQEVVIVYLLKFRASLWTEPLRHQAHEDITHFGIDF